MQIPDLDLQQPRSLKEAWTSLEGDASFDWMGGGTDLLCNYKWGINVPQKVISLRKTAELHGGVGTLAAGRTLYEIQQDPILRKDFPALSYAASVIASPLIRRTATLGGNLLLDTRCWHFNQTLEWRRAHGSCLKAEADVCRVMPYPGNLCVAAYSGDMAPVLLAYGANFVLAGPSGERTVPASDFYAEDGIRRYEDKTKEEILLRAELPKEAGDWTVAYQKLRLRKTFDFPEGGVAAAVLWKDGKVVQARLATTAYASVPCLYPEISASLEGGGLTEVHIEAAAEALFLAVRPMKNTSMSPAYRKKMARVLCRRALKACTADY